MTRLIKFFSITYALTWVCFVAAVKLTHGAPLSAAAVVLRGAVLLIGTFAPAIVALALTAQAEGRPGVLALLRRTLHWRVGAWPYVLAIAYLPVVKLAVALVYRFMTGGWPRFGSDPWYLLVLAMIVSTPVQAGEELGWRGYALPRMAGRWGYAWSSLLLGVIWSAWHLPVFFLPGADKYGQSFPIWTLQVVALSVAIAWLYARTNGSLLLTMLMHSAVNQTVGIVPSANAAPGNPFGLHVTLVMWLTLLFLWIAAAYFLARMPKPERGPDPLSSEMRSAVAA